MKKLIIVLAALLAVGSLTIAVSGCSDYVPEAVHRDCNSVYYWRTTFHLDSAESSFLRRHNVGRIYLRMFDVTKEAFPTVSGDIVVPNASVQVSDQDFSVITDELTDKEFVPVVYITLDALKAMKGEEAELAEKIVTRVSNMCSYNELPNVAELQLDCDWTASTEESFFALCRNVKKKLAKLSRPWRLSSTIRLHQLSRKVPPVDNGVLMVYNTGSFNDPDATNSIISEKDVKPYVKHLAGYKLPLDVAYPLYSWQLLFRKRQFIGLLDNLDLGDTTRFARRSNNEYVAIDNIPYGNHLIRRGDVVRQETSTLDEIMAVKRLIDRKMEHRPHSRILYHLDSENLSKYSPYEIDSLYSSVH